MSTDEELAASLRKLAEHLRREQKPMSAVRCEECAERIEKHAATIESLTTTHGKLDKFYSKLFAATATRPRKEDAVG